MANKYTAFPGEPHPLGATFTGEGTNFVLFSAHATAVYLCLFERTDDGVKEQRIKITERSRQTWFIFIQGVVPGQLYGYRVEGPFDPNKGDRYNPNKLLLDPYAAAVTETFKWNDALFGYQLGHPDKDLSRNDTDSAPYMWLSVVVDSKFDWGNDQRPQIPLHTAVIYEAHVRGLTMLHPDVPKELRGTYRGLCHPSIIKYLKDLGITSIELMPVHHFLRDKHLLEKGLTNYWGYNTVSFFAPDPGYASDKSPAGAVNEFKEMVKAFHEVGIEVILDVVYNHTAEGNELGPTLSFKGIDNTSYYRLKDEKRYYQDYTGTGNTLNTTLPNVMQLIMDSLRLWVTEMHVDGFRFDLAATLARSLHEVNMLSAFFDIIQQDPVVSNVKLIAEPWDLGEGGYQVGKFPDGWTEWNGKYRDCIRDYWRGAESMLGEFALRLTGSPDLYAGDYRTPLASINFITAHDGFTLNDLVSYNERHNEANGENNKDGDQNNRSWNCGAEGDTQDPCIIKLRSQQKRNFLATLFLSTGVPMLTAGDEMGKTQKGNNNAYCQDNNISWIDWEHADKELTDFVRNLIRLRHDHPVFCRRKWFQGRPVKGRGLTDVKWFQPGGSEMSDDDWRTGHIKSLAIYLNGKDVGPPDDNGKPTSDNSFYLLFNAHSDKVEFVLPSDVHANEWIQEIDTAGNSFGECETCHPKQKVMVSGRTVIVFRSSSLAT
jgi:isoamylase